MSTFPVSSRRHSIDSGFELPRQFPEFASGFEVTAPPSAFSAARLQATRSRNDPLVSLRAVLGTPASQHDAIDSRRINSRSSEQVLGSYSPTSMSTSPSKRMRRPANRSFMQDGHPQTLVQLGIPDTNQAAHKLTETCKLTVSGSLT